MKPAAWSRCTARASGLVLLLMVAGAIGPAPVSADRYGVTVSDLPSFTLDDGTSYITRFRLDAGFAPVPADTGLAQALMPDLPAPAAATAPVPVTDAAAARTAPPGAATPVRPPADVEQLLGAGIPAPDAAFLDQIRNIYLVTDPGITASLWRLYLMEDPTLSLGARCGNVVLAYSQATGVPLALGSLTLMNPLDTRAVTYAVQGGGLRLREAPWGPPAAALYPPGTELSLRPPAEDGWYHVISPNNGWVNGLFIKP